MRNMFWLLGLLVLTSFGMGVVKQQVPHVPLMGTPAVVSFSASPANLVAGQTTTLTWEAVGADSLAMDFGPANLPASLYEHRVALPAKGTLKVRPMKDTQFIIHCESVAGLDCQPHIISVHVSGSGAPIPLE